MKRTPQVEDAGFPFVVRRQSQAGYDYFVNSGGELGEIVAGPFATSDEARAALATAPATLPTCEQCDGSGQVPFGVRWGLVGKYAPCSACNDAALVNIPATPPANAVDPNAAFVTAMLAASESDEDEMAEYEDSHDFWTQYLATQYFVPIPEEVALPTNATTDEDTYPAGVRVIRTDDGAEYGPYCQDHLPEAQSTFVPFTYDTHIDLNYDHCVTCEACAPLVRNGITRCPDCGGTYHVEAEGGHQCHYGYLTAEEELGYEGMTFNAAGEGESFTLTTDAAPFGYRVPGDEPSTDDRTPAQQVADLETDWMTQRYRHGYRWGRDQAYVAMGYPDAPAPAEIVTKLAETIAATERLAGNDLCPLERRAFSRGVVSGFRETLNAQREAEAITLVPCEGKDFPCFDVMQGGERVGTIAQNVQTSGLWNAYGALGTFTGGICQSRDDAITQVLNAQREAEAVAAMQQAPTAASFTLHTLPHPAEETGNMAGEGGSSVESWYIVHDYGSDDNYGPYCRFHAYDQVRAYQDAEVNMAPWLDGPCLICTETDSTTYDLNAPGIVGWDMRFVEPSSCIVTPADWEPYPTLAECDACESGEAYFEESEDGRYWPVGRCPVCQGSGYVWED